MTYRALIAEDEERMRRLLRMYLQADSAAADEADNGEDALTMALAQDYDIVLLDWMMPGISGLEVCQLLKCMKSTPVILLTAHGDESYRIKGFEAGADDYVSKPFSPRELICRIHAILKRTKTDLRLPDYNSSAHKIMSPFSPVSIEHHARRVMVEGSEISLTLKEYDLLRFLAMNERKTFSREELFIEVWKHEPSGDYRTVDSHIKRIREKMHAVTPVASQMITTVWGIGYRFDPPAPNDREQLSPEYFHF
ncbi:response regulator transcription factor [Paenibacillus thalictri]